MKPVDILLLISELEGCYTHTKRLGFEEDNAIFDQLRKKYYKTILQTQERREQSQVAQWQSRRLLIGWSLVQIQPWE